MNHLKSSLSRKSTWWLSSLFCHHQTGKPQRLKKVEKSSLNLLSTKLGLHRENGGTQLLFTWFKMHYLHYQTRRHQLFSKHGFYRTTKRAVGLTGDTVKVMLDTCLSRSYKKDKFNDTWPLSWVKLHLSWRACLD